MSIERIEKAAIMYPNESDTVWSLPQPNRHADIIKFHFETTQKTGSGVQGFLTNLERFVGRSEAAEIAFKAGQIKTKTKTLYSEDLW